MAPSAQPGLLQVLANKQKNLGKTLQKGVHPQSLESLVSALSDVVEAVEAKTGECKQHVQGEVLQLALDYTLRCRAAGLTEHRLACILTAAQVVSQEAEGKFFKCLSQELSTQLSKQQLSTQQLSKQLFKQKREQRDVLFAQHREVLFTLDFDVCIRPTARAFVAEYGAAMGMQEDRIDEAMRKTDQVLRRDPGALVKYKPSQIAAAAVYHVHGRGAKDVRAWAAALLGPR